MFGDLSWSHCALGLRGVNTDFSWLSSTNSSVHSQTLIIDSSPALGGQVQATGLVGSNSRNINTILLGHKLANSLLLLLAGLDGDILATLSVSIASLTSLLSPLSADIIIHHVTHLLGNINTLGLLANLHVSLTGVDGYLSTVHISLRSAQLLRVDAAGLNINTSAGSEVFN